MMIKLLALQSKKTIKNYFNGFKWEYPSYDEYLMGVDIDKPKRERFIFERIILGVVMFPLILIIGLLVVFPIFVIEKFGEFIGLEEGAGE